MTKGMIFWMLMILWLIFGLFVTWGSTYVVWGPNLLLFVLLFLLGWKVFGFMVQD